MWGSFGLISCGETFQVGWKVCRQLQVVEAGDYLKAKDGFSVVGERNPRVSP